MIGDLVVDAVSLEITRTGEARYRIDVAGEVRLAIELWTARKARLEVACPDSPPAWIRLTVTPDGELDVLRATDCQLHLEQMDRRTYCLGLSSGGDFWGFFLSSPAYAKARIVAE